MRFDEVASTQDVARQHLADLPVVVSARRQTKGRGRSAGNWLNAPVAMAASIAFHPDSGEDRPLSLMAGVAAIRMMDGIDLKWPNDLMRHGSKVGGILVERNEESIVIGMGLNLFWPEAPEGMAAVHDDDPGVAAAHQAATLWAAEVLALVDTPGWPVDEYRTACVTLGREIVWESDGRGRAIDVDEDGALIVEGDAGRQRVVAGAIRHVRLV
ncbi:MAG TPA: biotin--[acetyl-CoA-carboxylase] ligase [Acidimicrobiia bacterium]|nr:biotin--[acetyl-CoA-carboxylase] ligase [Acidimicrobiia bacterium]